MGHTIRAVVGKLETVANLASRWVRAEVTELRQDFGLVLIGPDLLDDINELVASTKTDPWGNSISSWISGIEPEDSPQNAVRRSCP